jgi:Uma2 family endonuclease
MLDKPFGKFLLLLGKLKDKISEEDYFEICQLNEMLLIERNKEGDWEIQSLGGGIDGARGALLTGEFGRWVEEDGTGIRFAALTGFALPNGAVRAPDASWIRRERWDSLTKEKQEKFATLYPDFVVELCALHESVEDLKAKMEEYIENGASLGWLIDPTKKKVYVYRPNAEVETLDNPQEVSGEPLLKGFLLNMKEIWD